MFLNVRDILPAEIPVAASLLDTLDVLLAVAYPSSWLSGDLVNQLFKIFLGHALEESIKVVDNSKANDEIALPQDLTLENVLLLAASILQEARNRDPHDMTLPFSPETLMVDNTLVLNMADIIGHYHFCHVKDV